MAELAPRPTRTRSTTPANGQYPADCERSLWTCDTNMRTFERLCGPIWVNFMQIQHTLSPQTGLVQLVDTMRSCTLVLNRVLSVVILQHRNGFSQSSYLSV